MAISTIGTNGLDQTNNIELGATGNVGIGTASPTYKLHVNGSLYAVNDITTPANIVGTGSTTTIYNAAGAMYVRGGTGAKLSLGANNSNDLMVIDSSGNVGIGTSSPGSTGKFVVDFVGDGSKFASFLSTSVGVQSYGAYATSHVRMTYPAVADWDLLANSGGALTISKNATERMRIDSSGNLLFNSGYGSVATAYGCRAWVNFGWVASAVTIRGSGNVSSVTRNSQAVYTVSFTNAMPDTNYSTIGAATAGNTTRSAIVSPLLNGTYSTSAVQVICSDVANTYVDPTIGCVSIFR